MAESTHSKSGEESETQQPDPFFGLSEEEIIETVLNQHKPSRNPFVRGIWITVGSIGVLFAIIGIFLPGWPTTSWLVLSAYCYARSSKKMFKWLLTNPMFGAVLLEYYRSGKSLPFHSKIVIGGVICLASIGSIYVITKAGDPGFGQALIAVVAIIGVWWVGWKVPTTA
ncbi:MAG: YbaN family protein [Candidatus Poseidoniaceae archaeon]|nr:YbaN family protein [Candidatus Poseidoniaceae archaeon]